MRSPQAASTTAPASRTVTVWDAPTRIFHWALVLCLAGSWWTAENDDWETHLLFGYGVLGLVAFRLIWGLLGSETARFRHFLKGPGAALSHLRGLVLPGPLAPEAGHNPAGGYAVALILLLLALQVGTGLFLSGGDIFLIEAPLSGAVSSDTTDTLEWLHETNFNLLLALAGLHVVAVLGYWGLKRANLIRPMLTGRMELPADARPPRIASSLLALMVAGGVALSVWAFVTFV
ncbi:cytochrome b/b6 domain-containing protein [Indioceanicola profundi]|uniref:cytochrome b/b6 domain-containing protein n=1 Tax=Indioceanicola profundi TaxID=2220096 RepID=UPI000E6A964B|nr:cytochrome b/b6 domain-containing protein [Indioceanicola profundi]